MIRPASITPTISVNNARRGLTYRWWHEGAASGQGLGEAGVYLRRRGRFRQFTCPANNERIRPPIQVGPICYDSLG